MTIIECHERHRERLLRELPQTSAGYAAWVTALHELEDEILKLKRDTLTQLRRVQQENGVQA